MEVEDTDWGPLLQDSARPSAVTATDCTMSCAMKMGLTSARGVSSAK